MTSHKKIEQRLDSLGKQWRERPSMADRVLQRLEDGPVVSNKQPNSWLGGLTMTQRITYGSACAAALVLLVFLTFTSSATVTFAQVAQNIASAKTYSVKLTMKMLGDDAPKNLPVSQTVHARLPDSFRRVTQQEATDGKPMHNVNITHHDRPGIEIDHPTKSYRTIPPAKGVMPPLAMLEKLGQYSGKAQQNLGAKSIDGTKCSGFEIDLREIDPDADDGMLTVWVDTESMFPHQAEIRRNKPVPMVLKMTDFVWNAPLDDALFDTTPPEGYVNKTKPPEPIEVQVQLMVDALKLYAKLSGGNYPKVSQVYGDTVRDEMMKMAGFNGKMDKEWLQDPKFQEIMGATRGFGRITVLQRNNPNSKFFGKTVTPKDTDGVLLYWQLTDGKFHVIYGDLRSESVTAEKIKSL